MIIQLPYKWLPRAYQMRLWFYLENGGKRAAAVWHSRAGKDEVALHWTAVATQQRVGNYWHMLPEASQARKAIWDAVNPHSGRRRIDEVFPKEIRKSQSDQEMKITFKNGSTWQVVGSDNYDSLVGSTPIGVVFSEWSLANPLSWAFLRPILLENGGWSVFIYTSRGQNHGADLYNQARSDPGWYAERLTVDDTNIFTKEQLEGERRELMALYGDNVGDGIFRQEYYSSFDAAVMGSVYGEWIEKAEKEGRIVPNLYDPELEVYTAWDLGYDDSTVIIYYQIALDGIRIIDCDSASQQDIPYYCGLLREKPYTYHKAHNVPHDAANKLLAAAGKSIVQQAYELGVKMKVIPSSSQGNQLAALRQSLPRMWFDSINAAKVVKALKNYRFKYDEKLKMFSHEPIHDDNSHYCFVGDTEIITRYGKRQISQLSPTGEVLTLFGWMPYTNPRLTRKNAPLVEVRFADQSTVKCTPDHMFLTVSGWKSAENLKKGTQIQSTLMKLPAISMGDYTGCGPMKFISPSLAKEYIAKFGNVLLVKYLKNVISTIKTRTYSTIDWIISNVLMLENICGCRNMLADQESLALVTMPEKKQKNGTNLPLDCFGTKDIQQITPIGIHQPENLGYVKAVVKNLWRFLGQGFTLLNSVLPHVGTIHIESVVWLQDTQEVYCLTVPNVGHFSLANGAVVKNCDAMEIIGLTNLNKVTSAPAAKPRFLHEMTADDVFWGEESAKPSLNRL